MNVFLLCNPYSGGLNIVGYSLKKIFHEATLSIYSLLPRLEGVGPLAGTLLGNSTMIHNFRQGDQSSI